MSGLRRRSLVLSLAAATALTGAVAAPAVAAPTVSSASTGATADASSGSTGTATGSLPEVSTDLPTSPAQVAGSVAGSVDDNCGGVTTSPSLAGVLKCGIAVTAGATVFFQVAALIRSLVYTVTGI